MKFLSKDAGSQVLVQNITYRKKSDNSKLKELLMKEQLNFCAYTEKYLQPLDSVEVEHFDSSIKYKDDYYNYYAVIRNANLFKQDEKYRNASFFKTRFFQNQQSLIDRIGYSNNIYYEIDPSDTEAKDFIDFLNLNHPTLSQQRSNHLKRLKNVFQAAKYDNNEIQEYFSKHPEELSHITAIEESFGIDLFQIINN